MNIIDTPLFLAGIAFLMLIIMSLKGVKSNLGSITIKNFFDKEQTDILRGIAIVFVVYCHYFGGIGLPYYYTSVGTIGVGLFFLMSGFGLMTSRMRKKDYNKNFMRKRLSRIYPTFTISFVICCIIYCFLSWPLKTKHIIDFLILSLPDSVNWYLKVQVIMYVVFWLLSLIIKDNKKFVISLIGVSVLYFIIANLTLKNDYMWYETAPVFSIGAVLAFYKEKVYNIVSRKYKTFLFASFGLIFISFGLYYYIGGLYPEIAFVYSAVLLFFMSMFKLKGSSKVMKFLGNISLELYLSHTIILKVSSFINLGSFVGMIIFLSLSIILAIIIKFFSDRILKVINYKSTKSVIQ